MYSAMNDYVGFISFVYIFLHIITKKPKMLVTWNKIILGFFRIIIIFRMANFYVSTAKIHNRHEIFRLIFIVSALITFLPEVWGVTHVQVTEFPVHKDSEPFIVNVSRVCTTRYPSKPLLDITKKLRRKFVSWQGTDDKSLLITSFNHHCELCHLSVNQQEPLETLFVVPETYIKFAVSDLNSGFVKRRLSTDRIRKHENMKNTSETEIPYISAFEIIESGDNLNDLFKDREETVNLWNINKPERQVKRDNKDILSRISNSIDLRKKKVLNNLSDKGRVKNRVGNKYVKVHSEELSILDGDKYDKKNRQSRLKNLINKSPKKDSSRLMKKDLVPIGNSENVSQLFQSGALVKNYGLQELAKGTTKGRLLLNEKDSLLSHLKFRNEDINNIMSAVQPIARNFLSTYIRPLNSVRFMNKSELESYGHADESGNISQFSDNRRYIYKGQLDYNNYSSHSESINCKQKLNNANYMEIDNLLIEKAAALLISPSELEFSSNNKNHTNISPDEVILWKKLENGQQNSKNITTASFEYAMPWIQNVVDVVEFFAQDIYNGKYNITNIRQKLSNKNSENYYSNGRSHDGNYISSQNIHSEPMFIDQLNDRRVISSMRNYLCSHANIDGSIHTASNKNG